MFKYLMILQVAVVVGLVAASGSEWAQIMLVWTGCLSLLIGLLLESRGKL